MASLNNVFWKMREFEAHTENVNCLALGPLGHKFGHVMATGGDDNKVNLWSIKKYKLSQIMNLSGHTSPVDCIQFNVTEEFICTGSRSGEIKIWNLEANKLVRTLIGHRDGVRCMDFNPWGDFLVSGSSDCMIRLWDCRKRGSIFAYPSHKARINSVKFSPDGQWVATGGDDCAIKIWDLRVGRVLKEFTDHVNSVTCVKFHPQEFLLATGSADRSVNFYDLENFQLVSSEKDLSSVRCLYFNPDGGCLFAGVRNYLKVVGWEPSRLFDSVAVNWDRVCDISTANNELLGGSFHLTKVSLFAVDLHKVQPFASGGRTAAAAAAAHNSATDGDSPKHRTAAAGDSVAHPISFAPNTSLRKSFSKADRPVSLKCRSLGGLLDGRAIEESTSGTDPEDELAMANIVNLTDYNEIFKAGRILIRTPPPPESSLDPEPTSGDSFIDSSAPQILAEFTDAEVRHSKFEAHSLDHSVNYYRPTFTSSAATSPTAEVPPRQITSPNNSLPPSPYSRSKSNLDSVHHRPRPPPPPSKQDGGGVAQTRPNNHAANNLNRNNRNIAANNVAPNNIAKYNVQRQISCKESAAVSADTIAASIDNFKANNMRHCTSEVNLSVRKEEVNNRLDPNVHERQRKHSFSRNRTNAAVSAARNVSIAARSSAQNNMNMNNVSGGQLDGGRSHRGLTAVRPTVDLYVSENRREDERGWRDVEELQDAYIPTNLDRPIGLAMDDFLPRSRQIYDMRSHVAHDVIVSETEALSVVMRGHEQVVALLGARQRNLQMAMAQGRTKDCKGAVEMAIGLNDMAVLVDLLSVYNHKYTLWNLDLCATVLPKVQELIQSKYETYISTGCESLKLILRYFGSVIKANVQNPIGSFGVDIPREERYRKSVKCHEHFDSIASIVLKKQSLAGNVGSTFKEIKAMFNHVLD